MPKWYNVIYKIQTLLLPECSGLVAEATSSHLFKNIFANIWWFKKMYLILLCYSVVNKHAWSIE